MTLSATWHGHAGEWKRAKVRAPWVPTRDDIALMRDACPASLIASNRARVLVLGVTPAIVLAPWPEGFEITAADYDQDMIDALWSAEAANRAEVIRADWAALPFPDDHFDLVVGDGSFCALPSLGHYPAVLAEILRVARPSAPIIARFFMRPDQPPTLHEIVSADSIALQVDHDPSELRFLTIMATCDPDGVMAHQKIAGKIQREWGDLDSYIAAVWPDEQEAATFRLAFERQQCLNFPTRRQIDEQFARFGLKGTAFTPGYRLGALCPTIRFDR